MKPDRDSSGYAIIKANMLDVNASANKLVEEVKRHGAQGHVTAGEQAIAMGLAIAANAMLCVADAVLRLKERG